MKLVLRFNNCVPYEASWTETYPFEYESIEKAENDFFKLCWEARIKGKDFNFAGLSVEFDPSIFITKNEYYGPQIFTIEEWFKHYGQISK